MHYQEGNFTFFPTGQLVGVCFVVAGEAQWHQATSYDARRPQTFLGTNIRVYRLIEMKTHLCNVSII